MSHCKSSADCYFFQDCEENPFCLGNCVLSEWFWWKIGLLIMGAIGGIVACIRCKHCLFHKWLSQGKCWKKRKEIANSKFAITTISKDKEDTEGGIATFHDVMLVRSISIGKG